MKIKSVMKMENIKVPISFEDERGKIIDLIQNETINAITIVTFKKGAVRGNHYHKETFQWNYLISGKIKLVSQIPDHDVVEKIMKTGDLVVTGPDERHALVGCEESELLVLTKGPRGGKEYEKDTFRLEIPLII